MYLLILLGWIFSRKKKSVLNLNVRLPVDRVGLWVFKVQMLPSVTSEKKLARDTEAQQRLIKNGGTCLVLGEVTEALFSYLVLLSGKKAENCQKLIRCQDGSSLE